MKTAAIIPAAGSGTRYSKNTNKLLEEINGIPVIVHALNAISSVNAINEIIICTSNDLKPEITELVNKYKISKVKKIILGGKTRQESVFKGLKAIDNADYVVIHDGARPLISTEIINQSIETAKTKGAAIVAVKTKDTIKKADPNTKKITETLDRSLLWNVQTPQVFKYSNLLEAHERFKGKELTDDAALIEKAGYDVFICEGKYTNIKITTEEDYIIAKAFMNK